MKGETLMKYTNAEGIAYRKLQRVLDYGVEGGRYEYSEDEHASNTTSKTFQLPKDFVAGCPWDARKFRPKDTAANWTRHKG